MALIDTPANESWHFIKDLTVEGAGSETSWVTPALASLGDRLYAAWKGKDVSHTISVQNVSFDRGTLATKLASNERTHEAPALAVHNGRLFVAWNGDGNDLLNVGEVKLDNFGNPIKIERRPVLSEKSRWSPALASVGGNLYLAWSGTDEQQKLNISVSRDDGQTFATVYPLGKYVSPEQSGQGPALGVFNGNLFIAWTAFGIEGGDDRLSVARVVLEQDGENAGVPLGFSNKAILEKRSTASPSLAALSDKLLIAFIGIDGTRLFYSLSADGEHFDEARAFPDTGSFDPGRGSFEPPPNIRQSDRQHAPSLATRNVRGYISLLLGYTAQDGDQLVVSEVRFPIRPNT